jgi:hypothetical protein
MIRVRKSGERGRTRFDWLDSRHTFSFGDYYDRDQMGFGPLRVINEDLVAPATGFGMHPHRDMEILTYVLSGSLRHRDTLGNGSVLRAGDVQRMSAGTGILHSEENPSRNAETHFLQIWVLPERRGIAPEYEQTTLDPRTRQGRLRRIAGPRNGDEALVLHGDLDLHASLLARGQRVEHALRPDRRAWIQVARGSLTVNGLSLEAGDGAGATDEPVLSLEGAGAGEADVLIFDLP